MAVLTDEHQITVTCSSACPDSDGGFRAEAQCRCGWSCGRTTTACSRPSSPKCDTLGVTQGGVVKIPRVRMYLVHNDPCEGRKPWRRVWCEQCGGLGRYDSARCAAATRHQHRLEHKYGIIPTGPPPVPSQEGQP